MFCPFRLHHASVQTGKDKAVAAVHVLRSDIYQSYSEVSLTRQLYPYVSLEMPGSGPGERLGALKDTHATNVSRQQVPYMVRKESSTDTHREYLALEGNYSASWQLKAMASN